jgi:predicted transcriptional regulator
MTPEELQAALDKQAEAIRAANADMISNAVSEAVKPLQEQIEAMNAEREEAAKAEHAAAVEAVVNAKLMDEEEAKALPTKALNALVKSTKRAAPLAPGMATNSGEQDAWADYDLNANMEAK